MVTCPNCGYKQSSGNKCQKCSSLFSYYSPSETQKEIPAEKTAVPEVASVTPVGEEPRAGGFFVPWRTVYHIASGAGFTLLVVALVLIFHKSPPPKVVVDPQAAASAAAKISQAQAAAQQKQPFQVTLNPTEVNSYLNSNLQFQNAQPKPDATSPTAAPSPGAAATSDASSAAPAATPADPTIEDVQSAVKDVKVDMVGDLVKAYVTFDFHGKDMSLELDGHLSSENGYLQFEPVAGQLGSLPLPQSVLDAAVNKLMSSPENREKLRLPPGVNNLKVENGQVVVN
jgi:hypothetical protein